MLNRLGLVIHWSGFISGLMAFALCFSVVGFYFYEDWIEPAMAEKRFNVTVSFYESDRFGNQIIDSLGEPIVEEQILGFPIKIDSAVMDDVIKELIEEKTLSTIYTELSDEDFDYYFEDDFDGMSMEGLESVVEYTNQPYVTIVQKITSNIEEVREKEELRLFHTTPWYWYVLGLLFSPLLIVLIMLPAWVTRFILTGEKVFFPWRSADA
jgi:hypothetical protein